MCHVNTALTPSCPPSMSIVFPLLSSLQEVGMVLSLKIKGGWDTHTHTHTHGLFTCMVVFTKACHVLRGLVSHFRHPGRLHDMGENSPFCPRLLPARGTPSYLTPLFSLQWFSSWMDATEGTKLELMGHRLWGQVTCLATSPSHKNLTKQSPCLGMCR